MTRKAAICEIFYVVACVLAGEWLIPPQMLKNPLVFATPILLIVTFGAVSHLRHGEGARDLGLRLDNFLTAARVLSVPMSAACLLALLVGWYSGTLLIRPASILPRAMRLSIWLPIWGFLQQYALQAIVNRRAQVVWGKGACSILVVATLFAVLHLPNPWLALATFAGGIVWAYAYQRAPNLFALALSHWLMTLVLISTLFGSMARGMKVGAGYLLR